MVAVAPGRASILTHHFLSTSNILVSSSSFPIQTDEYRIPSDSGRKAAGSSSTFTVPALELTEYCFDSALPKHLYHVTCVYPCPSPGYYKSDGEKTVSDPSASSLIPSHSHSTVNTCFDCGTGVESCNSTAALSWYVRRLGPCSCRRLRRAHPSSFALSKSSTDYLAGKNCLKTCPTGSDPWPASE